MNIMKVVIPNKKRKALKKLKSEVYLLKKAFAEMSASNIEDALSKIQKLIRELEAELENR